MTMGKLMYDVPYYSVGVLTAEGDYQPTDNRHLPSFIVPLVQVVSADYVFGAGLPRHTPDKKRRRTGGNADPHLSVSDPRVSAKYDPITDKETIRILGVILRDVSPLYVRSEIYKPVRGSLYISFYLRGEGKNACMIKGEEHRNNTAQFTVNKRTGRIKAKCGHPECKAMLAADPDKWVWDLDGTTKRMLFPGDRISSSSLYKRRRPNQAPQSSKAGSAMSLSSKALEMSLSSKTDSSKTDSSAEVPVIADDDHIASQKAESRERHLDRLDDILSQISSH